MPECCAFRLNWSTDEIFSLEFKTDDVGGSAALILDRVNGERIVGSAINKAVYTESVKMSIKASLKNKGFDITDNDTFMNYADYVNKIDVDNPPWGSDVADSLFCITKEKVTGSDKEQIESSICSIRTTKNSIKKAIKGRYVDVPEDIPFSDYPKYIDDILENWTKPDYFPVDIIKILDEDEDSNRIIANGGGSLIILVNANMDNNNDFYFEYGAEVYARKKSDDGLFAVSQTGYFQVRFDPNKYILSNDNNKYYWYILYYLDNDPEKVKHASYYTPKHVWTYVKVHGYGASFCYHLQYISGLDKFYLGRAPGLLAECINLRNSKVSIWIPKTDTWVGVQRFIYACGCVKHIRLSGNPFNVARQDYTFDSNLISIDGVIDLQYQGDDVRWWGFSSTMESVFLKNAGAGGNYLMLDSCHFLRVECLRYAINEARNVSHAPRTMRLGATNLAKLTDTEKKVATDKGWILA